MKTYGKQTYPGSNAKWTVRVRQKDVGRERTKPGDRGNAVDHGGHDCHGPKLLGKGRVAKLGREERAGNTATRMAARREIDEELREEEPTQ